jgi:YVTN family beta-propeller protein
MHLPIPARAAALFLMAAAGLAPAAAHASGIAFVINSNDASISEIDVTTQKEIRRIPVLREPHHMALTPDGKSLLVGDTAGNALFFLDPHTGAVQRQMTVSDPYQITFSPDGRFLTVAGLARNQIDIYDAATMQLLHRIPASAMPSHINYSPDSSMVFVSLQESDSLIAIEPASGKVLWKTKVGKTPAGVLWHDGKVLVGIMGQDGVAVVDPVDGHVDRFIHTGRGAHVLVVPPDRSVVYVTNRVDGTISVLDPKTLNVMRSIKVPGGPDDMDFAPDGHMWASLRWHQSVAIIDPEKGVLNLIPVGRSPHGIWLDTHMGPAQTVRAGS